jgi:magnesium transporter
MSEEKRNEKLLAFLLAKKFRQLREEIENLNEVDIADALEEIIEESGIKQGVAFFRLLKKDMAAAVFAELDPDDQLEIINGITDKEVHFIMGEMYFDDMIDTLEELPANIVDKIIEAAPKEERKRINTYLNYPDDSAGSLMTPDYVTVGLDMTATQALKHIKKVGLDRETVYTCYVKDSSRHLIGFVSLRNLVVADGRKRVKNLMPEEDTVSVNVYDDKEDVADLFRKYGFMALPVVDNEKRLVGIITADDIFEVMEEEATEDIERMAGVVGTSDSEYADISVFGHVLHRLPWLFILMVVYMFTGAIIGAFENSLSDLATLVTFLPMLMGTGGNSGIQASTLIIRGLATGDIELKDAAKVLWKELRISFIIGIVLAVVSVAINFARMLIFGGDGGATVALIVSLTMVAVVIVAKTLGAMLPMLAKKINIDPALMAAPMVTSLTDTIVCTIYFTIATIVLNII